MMEQKNKSRARVRLAVFCVLSIHVIGLMAWLMQGCRKPQESEPTATADTNTPPPMDTNLVVENNTNMSVPPVETNNVIPPTSPATEYAVMKGDTFSTIAKKFGVTTKQIQEANPNVQPTKLQIGQKLQIPSPSAMINSAPPQIPESSANGEMVYTVKSGDTLSKIATDHGTTLKALRAANPTLTTDKIKVGQKLKIPAKAATAEPMTAPVTNPVAH